MPQANQFCQKSVTFQLVAANLLPFSAKQVDQETGADLDPQNLAASRWAMSRSRGMCLGESKHYSVLLSLHMNNRWLGRQSGARASLLRLTAAPMPAVLGAKPKKAHLQCTNRSRGGGGGGGPESDEPPEVCFVHFAPLLCCMVAALLCAPEAVPHQRFTHTLSQE